MYIYYVNAGTRVYAWINNNARAIRRKSESLSFNYTRVTDCQQRTGRVNGFPRERIRLVFNYCTPAVHSWILVWTRCGYVRSKYWSLYITHSPPLLALEVRERARRCRYPAQATLYYSTYCVRAFPQSEGPVREMWFAREYVLWTRMKIIYEYVCKAAGELEIVSDVYNHVTFVDVFTENQRREND